MKRSVFFISDGTGITATNLGRSLLTQFDGLEFEEYTVPYVNTVERVEALISRINETHQSEGVKPLVFTTIINPEIQQRIFECEGLLFDFFKTFIGPLETELGVKSSHTVGRTHGMQDYHSYMVRINAVNFAMSCDDGINERDYQKADVILVGVSRSGKTPTCLYLALHYGLYAANYPITIDDMKALSLPNALRLHRRKIFGLSINVDRLQQIRNERRPNSDYSSLSRCQYEVREVENLLSREQLPWLNTTTRSIEEIAAEIVAHFGFKRRITV